MATSRSEEAWREEKAAQQKAYEDLLTYGDDADDFISWSQVIAEESALLEQKRRAREAAGAKSQGEPFSVAFSGGGIRAAAFQSGVLRQLAQSGLLLDVEYMVAVSGGAYLLSAFASHVIAKPTPTDPKRIHTWYTEAVARTIVRMQTNAGNFVRDFWKMPCFSEGGAGFCPRVCDLPLLLVTLLFTISIGPVLFVLAVLIPVAELIELYYGYAMRAAFCAPATDGIIDVLVRESPHMRFYFYTLIVLVGFSFFAFLGTRIFHEIKDLPTEEDRKCRKLYIHTCFHCLSGLSNRLTGLLFFVLFIVIGATSCEKVVYDMAGWDQLRRGLCGRFVCANGTAVGESSPLNQCAYLEHDHEWYMQPEYRVDFDCYEDGDFDLKLGRRSKDGLRFLERQVAQNRGPRWFAAKMGIVILSGATLVAFISIPFAPQLFPMLILTVGPLMVVSFIMAVVQFRTFGPITGQAILYLATWHRGVWEHVVVILMGILAIILPLLKEIKSVWHWYYVRCLQTNFFDLGQDRVKAELKADPWCPFVLLTGTVNDFMRPTDSHSISEISFSPLHTGSQKCRYVRTPPNRSLAQCTALSGAGCLDAISLSMQDHMRVRFWLEVLNLSWGDFILFESARSRFMTQVLSVVPYELKRYAAWTLHRIPAITSTFACCLLLFYGLYRYRWYPDEEGCKTGRRLISYGLNGLCFMICLSFFSFIRCLNWLNFSPLVRVIHQATKFSHKGWHAPRMLYVTDGGVQDCTGLAQLLRRRCKRILLVLAASDPVDDLAVLRTTMKQVTGTMKLASFYDPTDPSKDIRILLDEFKDDASMPYLRIGIRYGWTKNFDVEEGGCKENSGQQLGMLWIVKSRLPAEYADQPVRPLLTEDEILDSRSESFSARSSDESSDSDEEEPPDLTQKELGGLCCCDCCHKLRYGNCARKFPHLTFTGYMWLTPQLYNSLSRLGYAMSAPAIADMQRHLNLHELQMAKAADL